MIIDGEKVPEGMEEIAALVIELMAICQKHNTSIMIRALSSCLSMVIVNTAPSREQAEDLIESLANTILEIIDTMDEEGIAGWNDSEGHTIQ